MFTTRLSFSRIRVNETWAPCRSGGRSSGVYAMMFVSVGNCLAISSAHAIDSSPIGSVQLRSVVLGMLALLIVALSLEDVVLVQVVAEHHAQLPRQLAPRVVGLARRPLRRIGVELPGPFLI